MEVLKTIGISFSQKGDSKADVILGLLQWFCHAIVVTS
jgi:hypothetical protein